MANVFEGDFPSLHIVLERIDPDRDIARYYVLSIEPPLFAKHTLIRRWGRLGSFRSGTPSVLPDGEHGDSLANARRRLRTCPKLNPT
jgi:hypothetical protein